MGWGQRQGMRQSIVQMAWLPHQSSCLILPNAEIVGMHHHASHHFVSIDSNKPKTLQYNFEDSLRSLDTGCWMVTKYLKYLEASQLSIDLLFSNK